MMTELHILIDEESIKLAGKFFAIFDDTNVIVIDGEEKKDFFFITGWGDTRIDAVIDLMNRCARADKAKEVAT